MAQKSCNKIGVTQTDSVSTETGFRHEKENSWLISGTLDLERNVGTELHSSFLQLDSIKAWELRKSHH